MSALLKRYPPGIWITTLVLLVILYVPVSKTVELLLEYQDIKSKSAQHPIGMHNEHPTAENSVEAVEPAKRIFELLSHSSTANHISLKQVFLPVPGLPEKEVIVYTQQVTLQGSYVNILKCLQDVEAKLSPIKIVSIRFSMVEEKQVPVLLAHVYFQYVNFAK